MKICRALLKYDYFNFSLIILEYCEPDKCLIREKHYWDLFKPEYNIAQDPTAPFSGRKHSNKTKQILSEAKKGKNHPNYGKTLSKKLEQKYQMRIKERIILIMVNQDLKEQVDLLNK